MIQRSPDAVSLLDLAPDAARARLREWVAAEGLAPYRAEQIFRRLWIARFCSVLALGGGIGMVVSSQALAGSDFWSLEPESASSARARRWPPAC